MKKFLCMVFAILLIVGITGCTNSSPEVTDEPSQSEQETVGFYINGKSFNPDDYDALEIEEIFLEDYTDGLSAEYKVIDSSELSEEIISSRNGTMIIERCIGYVTNAETGDGEVLNAYDKDYNYISYAKCSQEIKNGTALITFLVYNPENNYIDDIIERYDFVITNDFEY